MSKLTDFVNTAVARAGFNICGNGSYGEGRWKLSIGNGGSGCVCEILLKDVDTEARIPASFGEFTLKEKGDLLVFEILDPVATIESRDFEVVFFKHV